jgi:predicted NBD/HSP70 family sugar kinase
MDFRTAKLSEFDVFRVVYERGAILRSELDEISKGTSSSTIYRLLDRLVQKQYLVEDWGVCAANGRPPKLYRINPGAARAIGVFIAWDCIGVSLVDIGGTVHYKKLFDKNEIKVPQDAIHAISSEIKNIQREYASPDEITGIGVSAFGPLIRELGILSHGYHKPSPLWDYVPVKTLLEKETNLPVCIDNLPGAFILHELGKDISLLQKKVAYFMIDRGVGSAFYAPGMSDLRVINTDQFAHITIDIHGDTCVCGRKGCLETYVSAESFIKKFASRVSGITCDAKDDAVMMLEKLSMEQDKKTVDDIVEEIASVLAIAILNYTSIIFPDYVFLGGRTMQIFPGFIAKVERNINENIRGSDTYKSFKISNGIFDYEGLLHGAANIMFRSRYHLFS